MSDPDQDRLDELAARSRALEDEWYELGWRLKRERDDVRAALEISRESNRQLSATNDSFRIQIAQLKAELDQLKNPRKPQLRGLIDRNGRPAKSWVGGYVINLPWFDGGRDLIPELDWAQANGKQAKLRLFASQAPGLLNLPTMLIRGVQMTLWWLPETINHYTAWQEALAKKYDTHPALVDVTISLGGMIYAEPLLRNVNEADSVATIYQSYQSHKQGILEFWQVDEDAILAGIQAHKVWKKTRTSMALNPYQKITSASSWIPDNSFTKQCADEIRKIDGTPGNNSARWPVQNTPDLHNILRGDCYFQTATQDKIGDWQQVLWWAHDYGAYYVELPRGYENWDEGVLRGWDGKFRE